MLTREEALVLVRKYVTKENNVKHMIAVGAVMKEIAAKFKAAMRADLIVSSGGVSVGDYDLVKEILQEVENSMQFWQIAMQPGRPLAFGALKGIPIVGLPGNPVSSMVSSSMVSMN
jgi:molybdenum cofactor synthesis domain-containing protein